jgi:DNA modification methylase
MTAIILRGDAAHLPLPDESVDLICTSPPYWGLRSYVDGGEHYDGQIGSEATPGEYIAALLACTREWMRVLKPQGSLFVNIGDAYSKRADGSAGRTYRADSADALQPTRNTTGFAPRKSLLGLPWRYAIRCVDDLGLILRAEIIWDKPNGLPESVTDRVRRSHEQVFHFTRQERYFAAVDEIREPHAYPQDIRGKSWRRKANGATDHHSRSDPHPLGGLPGSVWEIPSQPLAVPESLGLDHFAAFPMALPRRIILGWSPSGICTACGEGRRPVTETDAPSYYAAAGKTARDVVPLEQKARGAGGNTRTPNGTVPSFPVRSRTITGYACACTPYTDHEGSGKPTTRRDYNPAPGSMPPQGTYGRHQAGEYERVGPWREYHLEAWTPPRTRPAVVADPFGGTGTTSLVADVLGRTGISVDKSADYCRLARWRTTDPGERARAMGVRKPPPVPDGQGSLFDGLEAS